VVTLELKPQSVQEVVNVVETAPAVTTDRADRSLVIERGSWKASRST